MRNSIHRISEVVTWPFRYLKSLFDKIRSPLIKPGRLKNLEKFSVTESEFKRRVEQHTGTHITRRIAFSGLFLLGMVPAMILLFPAVFVWQYKINDDLVLPIESKFDISGGSRAVATASALLDIEINKTTWAPNKPWFFPIHYGDDMTNYQKGIVFAVSRWSIEMVDQLGRQRGSGSSDPDLEKASGALKYNPETWLYDISDSMLPRTSADQMYNVAIEALTRYNKRLANKSAVYDLRADNIIQALNRIRKDLGDRGSMLEVLILEPNDFSEEEIQNLTSEQLEVLNVNGGHFDTSVDDVFYAVKGRMYAYFHLLAALGQDAHIMLKEKNVNELWKAMLLTMRSGAGMYSISLSNGAPMSLLIPNHAAQIGFFVLRVDKQMKEIIDVLAK